MERTEAVGSAVANQPVEFPGTVNLDPFVVSASRYEEEALKAPASVTILRADRLSGEGVPDVVAALRTVVGVDVQQTGISRYLVAVRGFNSSFTSTPYVMVDFQPANLPSLGAVDHTALPVNMLDVDRVEIVRGPGSALYGPGVEQGIIHFITKDPFEYPGTALAIGVGEQSLREVSFRQAGVIGDKLGYKITGSLTSAKDWKLDPDDPQDGNILARISPVLRDIDGTTVRPLGERDYDTYTRKVSGQLEYRFDTDTRLIADASFATMKRIIDAPLGEIQVDGPAVVTAQLRFERGPLWAQLFGVTDDVDGDNYWYRTGNLMYDRSSEIGFQARYQMDLWDKEDPVVFGADFKHTTPKSRGTIYGRFEDMDNFNEVGGYVQATKAVTDQLDLRASVRVDSNDADETTVISPRLALVYQPGPEHTFRLTYNRASSRPLAGTFFNDLEAGGVIIRNPELDRTITYPVRFLGSNAELSFSDPLQTSSSYGTGRDSGVGMATARAYEVLTQAVIKDLEADNPGALQAFLASKTSAIDGLSQGSLTFPLSEVEARRPPITDTFEVGYKSVWQGRFLVGLDAYYTKKKDFLFTRLLTPFVIIPAPALRDNLDNAVRSAFTDAELAPFGIDVETLASVYAAASAGLANRPIGIIEPEQNYDPETSPELVSTTFNAGSIDYFGVDLSMEAFFNEHWSAFANLSWVSENYFDEEALGLPGTSFGESMNSPQNKFRAGVTYRSGKGLTVDGTLRYNGRFQVGTNSTSVVDAYTLFDLNLGYEFSGSADGVRLAITAQNLFDHLHREYTGSPKIGRLVTSRLTCEF